MAKLTTSLVKNLTSTGKRYSIWDGELKGLGVRVSAKGDSKSFILKYVNAAGKQQMMTLGKFGALTVQQARNLASKARLKIANGEDPQADKIAYRDRMTVNELCDEYIKNGMGTKKPSTISTDLGRIQNHIRPLLGKKAVADLNRSDIKAFVNDVVAGKTAKDVKTKKHGRSIVRGGSGGAVRTNRLLTGILSYAVELQIIDTNPSHGVKLRTDKKKERFLNVSEIERLKDSLKAAGKTANPYAISIIRLLILTGCRKGEIEGLKWSEIRPNFDYIDFHDSKTGQKTIPISDPVRKILQNTIRINGSPYVFPGTDIQKPYQGLKRVWERVRLDAGLEDVRIHDLRHTFASMAANKGVGLAVVASLLGHRSVATTKRYAHLFDETTKKASEDIASVIDV
jgi:integrase